MSSNIFPSPSAAPYTLPLSRQEFRQALASGHGRAFQHASVHGIQDRLEDVTHACLYNLAADPQCEDDRSSWVLSLIEAAGAYDRLVPELIDACTAPPHDEGRL